MMGLAQIRPTTSTFQAMLPSGCHAMIRSSRATTISLVPSPSRSATAGDASHDSCQRSLSAIFNSGALTCAVPDAGSQLGAGSEPPDPDAPAEPADPALPELPDAPLDPAAPELPPEPLAPALPPVAPLPAAPAAPAEADPALPAAPAVPAVAPALPALPALPDDPPDAAAPDAPDEPPVPASFEASSPQPTVVNIAPQASATQIALRQILGRMKRVARDELCLNVRMMTMLSGHGSRRQARFDVATSRCIVVSSSLRRTNDL